MMPPAMRNASMLMPMTSQERRAADGEQEQHEAGDAHRLERHAPAERLVRPLGHRGEERHQRDRLDHDEEQHEELEQLVDHARVPAAAVPSAPVDHAARAS